MKVLIDTNIMIDAITNRDGKNCSSAKVIDLCALNEIEGFLAPHSLSNMYYILRKQYSDSERRTILKRYSCILKAVELNVNVLVSAIYNDDITDFEDAIQCACAEAAGADYIVTRNTKDYAKSSVKAVSPEELLKLIS